jgi:hypothetical protein
MKTKIQIINEATAERACEVIRSLPLEPRHEVVIQEIKKDRTGAQNSLMWLWITIIAGELGETKDEIHLRLKKKFLVPIYERDDLGYAGMIAAVRTVHSAGMKSEAASLAAQILELTSTTKASSDQFTEYLNDIDRDDMGKGIVLPRPEDRHREAMGD